MCVWGNANANGNDPLWRRWVVMGGVCRLPLASSICLATHTHRCTLCNALVVKLSLLNIQPPTHPLSLFLSASFYTELSLSLLSALCVCVCVFVGR